MEYPEKVITTADKMKYDLFMESFDEIDLSDFKEAIEAGFSYVMACYNSED